MRCKASDNTSGSLCVWCFGAGTPATNYKRKLNVETALVYHMFALASTENQRIMGVVEAPWIVVGFCFRGCRKKPADLSRAFCFHIWSLSNQTPTIITTYVVLRELYHNTFGHARSLSRSNDNPPVKGSKLDLVLRASTTGLTPVNDSQPETCGKAWIGNIEDNRYPLT